MLHLPYTTIAAWLVMVGFCALPSARAQLTKLNDLYSVEGFSQPAKVSKVAGKTPGVIVSRNVQEGEFVPQGAILATLDQTIHQRRLEQARLAMEAQGDLTAAVVEEQAQKLRFKAFSDLAKRGHATEIELQRAEADLLAAQAAVTRVHDRQAQLKADYDRQLAEYEQCQIRAPFDGVLIDFQHEVGEYVGPGEPHVCTIAQLSTLSVEFLLPRSLRDTLTIDKRVKVLFTIDDVLASGTVTYISPIPNGETNTYVIKVRVDNSDGKLSAGERCLLGLDETLVNRQVSKHVEH